MGRAIKCHLRPVADLLKWRWTSVLSQTDTGNLLLLPVFSVILIRNGMWCQMCVIWLQGLPRFMTIQVGFYGAHVTKVNNNTTGWLWSNNETPSSPHPSPRGVVLSRSSLAAGLGAGLRSWRDASLCKDEVGGKELDRSFHPSCDSAIPELRFSK